MIVEEWRGDGRTKRNEHLCEPKTNLSRVEKQIWVQRWQKKITHNQQRFAALGFCCLVISIKIKSDLREMIELSQRINYSRRLFPTTPQLMLWHIFIKVKQEGNKKKQAQTLMASPRRWLLMPSLDVLIPLRFASFFCFIANVNVYRSLLVPRNAFALAIHLNFLRLHGSCEQKAPQPETDKTFVSLRAQNSFFSLQSL